MDVYLITRSTDAYTKVSIPNTIQHHHQEIVVPSMDPSLHHDCYSSSTSPSCPWRGAGEGRAWLALPLPLSLASLHPDKHHHKRCDQIVPHCKFSAQSLPTSGEK